MSNEPRVYLVGAGPGDEGLITVRGLDLIKSADCIIYDKLANAGLLRYARKEAELIYAGKRSGEHSLKQGQINELLIKKAKEHNSVVRLKGGDPCIFGRGAEEAEALAGAGIKFEIVPGITAAIGAAASAGIMLTHRDYSSAAAFVTGHEAADKKDSSLDWDVLAKFKGTLVFYMGMGSLEMICRELVGHGMNPQMPVAVVANATLPNQQTVTGTLETINNSCVEAGVEPPALIIVGEGAKPDEKLSWFNGRELSGQRVLITRDAGGNAELARKLGEAGAQAIEFAGIEFEDLTGSREFEIAIGEMGRFEWVIFTSSNGVGFAFNAIYKSVLDARVFGNCKVAVIGTKTAEALMQHGIRADFVPATYTGRDLGKELADKYDLSGANVLLLRSAIANDDLPGELEKAGAILNDVKVYTTIASEQSGEKYERMLDDKQVDWITFTSSSTVRAFFEKISDKRVKASGVKIASIGPMASKQIEELGFKADIEARVHTTDGLVTAMCEYVKTKKSSK